MTPEIVEFELEGKKYRYNVRSELKIDKANLDTELSQQPALYGFMYVLSETLRWLLEQERLKVDIALANQKDEIKTLEGKLFMDAKKQGFTDGQAKEFVKANEERRDLVMKHLTEQGKLTKKVLEMELTYRKMRAFVDALAQRAMMLTTLGGMAKREMSMSNEINV